MTEIVVDGESLTPADVEAVARHDATVAVAEQAREDVRTSRERIEDILDTDEAVYGVNTGFGELVQKRIPEADIQSLQRNLIRSHAAGAGENLAVPEVRGMMVTRLNALVKGFSGIRERVIDLLVDMLNEGVHPVVKSKGSLGASGDLAPLAHLALIFIGEGAAFVDGDRLPGEAALARRGLEPISLRAKEGLALINGTQLTVALASLVVCDAERILRAADIAGALTTEVTMSTTASAHPRIHDVRPHPGHSETAKNLRRLTDGSEIIDSHRNCDRVQDPYSIRCMPQVHGAVRDSLAHLREIVTTELNSATDNPLVFDAERVDDRASGTEHAAVLSGGNFHGEPLALPLDYVSGALTEIAAIAERRIDRLLNPNIQEEHLPAFLTDDNGLQSGYMIVQYTAADLVSTNRSIGRPSTDNIPVSGNQEDHVSMSATSAHHAREITENTRHVVAAELVCAAQAMDFLEGLDPGTGTGAAYEAIRERVPFLDEDRTVGTDVEAARDIIADSTLLNRVEAAIDGELA
ncbi:MAG: histidine ammonia-lyase [Halobacteriota archaeon]|uniref:histidine ammonia-lyase n=1 Tax=Natronomonas sp. TaxID=2184060 RepID=UPI00397482FC